VLSGAKTLAVKDLASRHVIDERLVPTSLHTATDDEILRDAPAGARHRPWSVDMFLMFALARPDVLPVGDLGIRKGMLRHFKLRKLPEPDKIAKARRACGGHTARQRAGTCGASSSKQYSGRDARIAAPRTHRSPRSSIATARSTTRRPRAKMTAGTLPLLGEWMFGGQQRRPPAPLPLDRPHEIWATAPSTGFRVTWLGHSTVVLELDGPALLTDRYLAKRVSPVGVVGPRPISCGAGAARRATPDRSRVAVARSLRSPVQADDALAREDRGSDRHRARASARTSSATRLAADRITELDWNESAEIAGIHVTATPAQHFSGRSLLGRNRTLWASWVIRSERRRVFFSGDTA